MIANRTGEVGVSEGASDITQSRKHPVGQLCWHIFGAGLEETGRQAVRGPQGRVAHAVLPVLCSRGTVTSQHACMMVGSHGDRGGGDGAQLGIE